MQSKICYSNVCISINSIILGLILSIIFLYFFSNNRIIIIRKNKSNNNI